MFNVCPNCKDPYLRHKGKKIKQVLGNKFIEEKTTIKVYWTEEGYYCKRCKKEFSLKEVKEFGKKKV